MRESCTYGSVRGAPSNGRPYRDRREFITLLGGAAASKTWVVGADGWIILFVFEIFRIKLF